MSKCCLEEESNRQKESLSLQKNLHLFACPWIELIQKLQTKNKFVEHLNPWNVLAQYDSELVAGCTTDCFFKNGIMCIGVKAALANIAHALRPSFFGCVSATLYWCPLPYSSRGEQRTMLKKSVYPWTGSFVDIELSSRVRALSFFFGGAQLTTKNKCSLFDTICTLPCTIRTERAYGKSTRIRSQTQDNTTLDEAKLVKPHKNRNDSEQTTQIQNTPLP